MRPSCDADRAVGTGGGRQGTEGARDRRSGRREIAARLRVARALGERPRTRGSNAGRHRIREHALSPGDRARGAGRSRLTSDDSAAEKLDKIVGGLGTPSIAPWKRGVVAEFLDRDLRLRPSTMDPHVQRRKTIELLAAWNARHEPDTAVGRAGRRPALVRSVVARTARTHDRAERHHARSARRHHATGIRTAVAGPLECHAARSSRDSPGSMPARW